MIGRIGRQLNFFFFVFLQRITKGVD